MTRQPEAAIKRAIADFLRAGQWFVVPIVQSALSHKGIADLVAMKDGRTVWIEIKTPTGRLSDWQEAFRLNVTQAGGEYIVARRSEDVDCLVECLRPTTIDGHPRGQEFRVRESDYPAQCRRLRGEP